MADGIRLDLQEALARGPSEIPNLEPLFAPGAIPPIFDEAPEVQEGPGFAPEEQPIASPGVSIGQPVPPVKESRGDRLRALLGNFLQNFGQGLQAASRAPSGAEFATGIGAALSAPEERRQQKIRIDLLRANQAFREQTAREQAERDAERFAFDKRQAEAGRIERETVRAGAQRRTFQDILTAGTQRSADILRERKQREEDKAFIREQGGTEFLRRLRLKRTPSGGRSGATKFPEAERRRLSESIALQLGIELPGTGPTGGLSPTGSFQFMLKLSKIGTKIDKIIRAGGDPEEVFGLAIEDVRRKNQPVNLDNVLAVISDNPRQ